ncbi:MAG: hypothetical protein K2Y32_09870 [Candidatus Obscuribacterales bacterium]|nr:hypothetical protein [Candidatus Obscuribacterales bacterium]
MNFDPASHESSDFFEFVEITDTSDYFDYTPPSSLVEATVVDAIIMGSGGPENGPITDAGLRFVRHIISQSKASNAGFLPNLKDINCIKELARDFINNCGGGTGALETMYTVMHLQ